MRSFAAIAVELSVSEGRWFVGVDNFEKMSIKAEGLKGFRGCLAERSPFSCGFHFCLVRMWSRFRPAAIRILPDFS